jgi:hypothetical protein
MAERPTTVRLAPEIEAAVRAFAAETGITFNAGLKVLISEALDARGRHPNKQRPNLAGPAE